MKKEKQPEFKIGQLQVISEAVNQSEDFSQKYTDDKLKSISWLMVGVVIVCFLAFIQLVVDSFHINSATYKEYSQKTESVETAQRINETLLKQIQDLYLTNRRGLVCHQYQNIYVASYIPLDSINWRFRLIQ